MSRVSSWYRITSCMSWTMADGVYDVASPAGERYGERALARAINATRLLPAAQVPRAILQELSGHRHTRLSEDDAMIVCLDWHDKLVPDEAGSLGR
ncbi:SpoIIE family protein phosphatase [Saccharothrix luteola]|uniref:SpoIIE family protein phosphatase n=1 Tax=Saccharothrix luteola TaxID=2893018 RepID=UPI001E5F42D6|nr:SpoIIE family protein phosphatase [Saccharothrix luteola]MCC8250862.1 SpoIIE family protein phosphatase [Saccharothrix luteola]